MSSSFTRRQALAAGFVAAVAVAGGSLTLASCSASAARPVGPIELPQPRRLRSSNGVLATELTPAWASADIGVGTVIRSYNYGGSIPGPTWDLQAGDRLKVALSNRMAKLNLPPSEHHDHGTDLTRPHAWTDTNLHTHGLHVSSEDNQDNPFIVIKPGETFDYDIRLPADHQPGFFWYHPHKHGSVTQQVRGGMAGALIVRGDLDDVPEIAAADEKVIVVQAIELGPDFELLDPIPDPSKSEAFFPRTQIFWTLNGAYKPTISM